MDGFGRRLVILVVGHPLVVARSAVGSRAWGSLRGGLVQANLLGMQARTSFKIRVTLER